jgi:hypothetical protein
MEHQKETDQAKEREQTEDVADVIHKEMKDED